MRASHGSAGNAALLCASFPRLLPLRAHLFALHNAATACHTEAARAAALQGCAVAEALFGAADSVAPASAPLVLAWWLQVAATVFSAVAPRLDADAADDGSVREAAAVVQSSMLAPSLLAHPLHLEREAPEAWMSDPARTLEPSRRAAALLRRRAGADGGFAVRPEEEAWATLVAEVSPPGPPLRGCAAMLLLEACRALRLWPRALFDAGREGDELLVAAADVLTRVVPGAVLARCDASGAVLCVADAGGAFASRAADVARRALVALPPERRGGAAAEPALRRWAGSGIDHDAQAAEVASEAARRRGPEAEARAAAATRCALASCAATEVFEGAFARCGNCRRVAYCCATHRMQDVKRHAKEECVAAHKVARKARADADYGEAPKARASIITALR